MWFFGLIIGAIIGAISGVGGVVLGAMAGAGAGWALSQKLRGPGIDRVEVLESAVRLLQQRVSSLESERRTTAHGDSAPAAAGESGETARVTAPTAPPNIATPPSASPVAAQPEAAATSAVYDPVDSPQTRGIPPTAPSAPAEPSALWNFFFGGNTLVRFGVIVLFFGVAFLLKYASEHIEISIEARFIGVALGAAAMLAVGWRLRARRPGYALIVQGGGIGVLYLTVFAAFRLYQLLPGGLVFLLLAAMAVFSAMLAVLQDSRSLAALGVSGGFLAPLLASTGGGSHVGLFSFYALLNLAILFIAWFKPWRSLNLLGFLFTFVIGVIWGNRYYRPEYFASTEPFLILFFLFYVAITVLFALRQDASVKDPVDGTLVFGVPIVGFGLQCALVRDIEYAAAFSALALSGFYLSLAKYLFSRAGANLRLLVESFLALGVVFGTLAIPLALDGRWTAAAWALEGAAIVWVGVRQEKIPARGFGYFLLYASGAAFFFGAPGSHGAVPMFNSFYLGCVIIAVSALFSAWFVKQRRALLSEADAIVAVALFCWGCAWWLGGALAEIHQQVARAYRLHAALLFISASGALFSMLHRRIDWLAARSAALALLPLLYIATVVEIDRSAHPFEHFGSIVWPLAIATNLWILRRHEDFRYIGWWHAAALWLGVGVISWEGAWWLGGLVRGGDVWRLVGWPLVPIALLTWLSDRGERMTWPVARHFAAYLFHGGVVLAGFLWLWMLHGNFDSSGDPAPLPYLPLFNPLDLAQGAALLTLVAWLRRMRTATFAPAIFHTADLAYGALGAIGFIWLNGALLRTLHHWGDVPFNLDAMTRSMLVQASLSIFWSLLALCTMVTATKIRLRPLWLAGAGLMAIVVAKLFFVDLSNVGGIERIVSFIGVGLLMLVV
ncbi:MAG: DUF2339 domain-containing protein, partial [Candidatus Binatia bacterium]